MTHLNFLGLFAGLLLSACQTQGNSEAVGAKPSSSATNASPSAPAARKLRRVAFSLIELIANPRFYDGTEVGVTAYLVLNKGGDVDGTLYLDRESARMNINTNSVSIRFGACPDRLPPPKEELVSPESETLSSLPGYVTLRGTFRPPPDDVDFAYGTICSITYLVVREDPEQGSGQDSWWNRARPIRSSTPTMNRPPR